MDSQNNNIPMTNSMLVLCITSLIAVGLTSLYDLMLMIISLSPQEQMAEAMQQSMEQVRQLQLGDPDQVDMNQLYKMIDNSPFHLFFNVIELAGIFLLFIRREAGIHFYLASQIGLAFIAYFSMGAGAMMIILTCILWALLYYKAYIEMFRPQSNSES